MLSALRTGKPVIEQRDLCTQCGGECCRRMSGAALPEDFQEPIFDSLLEAFKSGQWAVDWWEGDPREGMDELERAYFVRPAVSDAYGLFDPSWGGECVFLTPAGCALPPDVRPAGCRLLEPVEFGSCCPHGGTKQEAAIAWLPYTELILQAAKAARRE